jgi:hypothetical protein
MNRDVDQTDRGGALVLVLLFMALLTSLGAGLVTIASTEQLAADNYRTGVETTYASDAAAAFVARELMARPEWTTALCCDNHSSLADGTRNPRLPSGEAIDLDAETRRVQKKTDTEAGGSARPTRWRLFAWGPLERIVGASPHRLLPYAIAWIADDRSDADDDPLTDANGTIVVRVQVRGLRGAVRTVEHVLRRVSSDSSESADPSDPAGPSSEGGADGASPLARNLPEIDDGPSRESTSESRVEVLGWRDVQ